MKKVKYLLFLLSVTLFSVVSVSAASFSVTANKTTVVVGNSVNVTVKVNGSDAAGWEYCLNYDTSVFQLTSSNSSCIIGSTLAGNKTVTFTLKARKSGSSTFNLRAASILDDSANSVLTTSGSTTVRAKTQAEIEASYSTNANLSALRVVDHVISPEFNKDVLEYNLEVENEIEKIEIKATRADSKAMVSGTGEKDLTEGLNKFEIVVTAEKGNKKVYVINVTRKELNPIYVDVDGFKYAIVRKAEALDAPTYYTATEIEVQGEMVPAFNSDITGYTLVGLKDEDGNVELYRYNESDKSYVLYKQMSTEGVVFIPLSTDKLLEGYNAVKNVKINNINVKGYVGEEKTSYVMVYGMNAKTGKTNWYRYDTIENTLQRLEIDETPSKNEELYFLLTIIFAGLSGVTILLVIILVVTNSKVRKKNVKLISMLQTLRDSKKEKDSNEDIKTQIENNNKEKEKQNDLRKKQEEFLDTGENEIVEDDVELEDSEPVKKSKKDKKKKES